MCNISNGHHSLSPSLLSPTNFTHTHATQERKREREKFINYSQLNLMLGKRTFRRTTSMTEITLDVSRVATAPPSPAAMVGGEFNHMLSPRFYRRSFSGDCQVQTAEFLRRCGLCNRRLVPARDIYIYRGDTAFCSLECREEQMKQDERKESRAAAITEEPHHPETAAAARPPENEITSI